MKHFYSADSIKDINSFIRDGVELKSTSARTLNFEGKTLVLLFFNPSLRTRLSTQKAGISLGMHTICMNAGEGWKLELDDGVTMNLDRAEHIKDAARVISRYADVIGVRAFPGLTNKESDYRDEVLHSFMKYANVPVLNLESSIFHPCQSVADLMTIEEHRNKERCKIAVTWAPHPRSLPQAVTNSFLQWASKTNHEVVLTHPEGYELNSEFVKNCQVEYNREKALEQADFVYVKNWSSYRDYGKVLTEDERWTFDMNKWKLTAEAKVMHCLPVRRNVVISDDVMDSPHALVYDQAENRFHAARSILNFLMSE